MTERPHEAPPRRYRRALMWSGSRFVALVMIAALGLGMTDVAIIVHKTSPGPFTPAGAEPAGRSAGNVTATRLPLPSDPTVPGPVAPAGSAPSIPTIAPEAAPAPGGRHTGPWRVGTVTAHFVDPSRPAPARTGGGNGRVLDTVIQYPIEGDPSAPPDPGAPAPAGGAPFPLVVFVHGFDVTPTTYSALTEDWARAGYVVASPAFPGEVGGQDGATEDDLPNEPADVRFVISAMTAAGGPVRSAVDASRIAVAGHSDGGEVAAGVGLDRCCTDPRVKATIVMSGAELGMPGGGYAGVAHAPALVIQSDGDEVNDPSNAVQLYNDSPGQMWYLDLIGGRHLEPFLGTDPHWAIVPAVTTDFLDLQLKGGAGRLNRFEREAIVPGLAKLYLKH